MVFRLIRQNEKATKWVYIVVVVFTMFTFSVTGAVYAWFHESGAEFDTAGSFVTPSGRTVEVDGREFLFTQQRLARINSDAFKDDDAVWEFLMVDALADEAGIRISDEMLSASIQERFDAQGIPAAQRAEAYRNWHSNLGMSAAEFESTFRRLIRNQVYQNLFQEPMRIRSEDVFKKFQEENELLTVECVKFADSDFAAQVDKAAITDEQLQAFLDKDLDFQKKTREFSTPAEFTLDVAVIEIAAADVEKVRAAIPEAQRAISDFEIQRIYDERKETKYKLADSETKPAEGETKPAEGETKPAEGETKPADGETKPADDAAAGPKYRPLDEVKAEIEKELLIGRLVNAANADVLQRISAAAAKKAAEPPAPGVTDPAIADPAAIAEENHLRAAALQFGLEYVEAKSAIKWTDLATWERFGSEQVKQNLEYASKNATYPFAPTADSPRGFIVHVVEKVDPKPLPLAEIKEKLLEPYVEFQAKQRSKEAADAFMDALRAAARPKEAAKIEELEKAARERAEKKAVDGNVTDEAAKAKLVEDELKAIEPEIKALLDSHRHEVFDEVVASKGFSLVSVGPFRESYRQSRFYQLEPASLEKTVMGQFAILLLDTGKVTEPMRDDASKLHYVARVKEKRTPTYAEMGLGDEQRAQSSLLSQSWQKRIEQMQRFEYSKLALLLNLKRTEPEPAATPNQ